MNHPIRGKFSKLPATIDSQFMHRPRQVFIRHPLLSASLNASPPLPDLSTSPSRLQAEHLYQPPACLVSLHIMHLLLLMLPLHRRCSTLMRHLMRLLDNTVNFQLKCSRLLTVPPLGAATVPGEALISASLAGMKAPNLFWEVCSTNFSRFASRILLRMKKCLPRNSFGAVRRTTASMLQPLCLNRAFLAKSMHRLHRAVP